MATNAVCHGTQVSAPSRNGFRKEGVNGLAGAGAVLARAPTKTFGIQGGMNAAAIGAIEMMARLARWFVEAKQRAAVERQRDAAQADAPRAIGAQRITLAHESILDGLV